MERDRFRLVEELFFAALEREGAEREQFLASRCADDPELAQEVNRWLSADADASVHLAGAVFPAVRSLYAQLTPGSRVGPYEIVALLGEGGMGSVYRARRCDDVFSKEVAIKVVKRGMDTDAILRRFSHERRILATLEHPNIARVLDGGSTLDGLPFLVMEYVEGEPLTAYCDGRRLELHERLRLFQLVCGALEHAHRNLIVHRDLKPGNILVDANGQPHLLDFGIAKLLERAEDDTVLTTQAVRLFTPTYASPEQLSGEPVGVASDVYSLGLVLYEMLTGVVAHAPKQADKSSLRTAREDAIRPPSQAARAARESGKAIPVQPDRLRGDLDRIILKAVETEPRLRYGSVEQFAEDISCFLESRPVRARPPTWRYRARKFTRRHRAPLAAGVLLFVSLVGGIAYSTYQARRAETRFQQVRQLANTFVFDVHDAIQPLPGSTKARQLLVATGLQYLDSLAVEADGDPDLEWELAQAYIKLGNVQGAPRDGPNLGDTSGALTSHAKALSLLEKLAESGRDDLKVLRALTASYRTFGDLQVYAGREGEALAAFQQAIETSQTIVANPQREPADLRLRGSMYLRLGERQRVQGENAEAMKSFGKALEDFRSYAKVAPFETGQSSVALGLLRLATAYGGRGDVVNSVQTFREVVRIREELAARQPGNVAVRRELAVAYTFLAEQLFSPIEFSADDREESLVFFRKALAINEEVAAADPRNAQAQRDLSLALLKVARSLEPEDPEQALQLTERGVNIARIRSEADPESGDSQRIWIYSLYERARRLAALRRLSEALRSAADSLLLMEQVAVKEPEARREVVDDHLLIGDIHLRLGDEDAARRHYDSSVKVAQAIRADMPRDLFVLRQIADGHERIARLHAAFAREHRARQDACHEARAWFEKSLKVWDTWVETGGAAAYREERQRAIAASGARCGE